MTCNCDIQTGECQGPDGCQAIAEIERLKLELVAAQPLYSRRQLEAEVERLRAGVKEIDRFLTEGRHGDAHFICDALLTGVIEQLEERK